MPSLASIGLHALYELLHFAYSVIVFLSYLLSLLTTAVERRALLHRCLHPLSHSQSPPAPTAAAFEPSPSLVASSRPPFPSISKHPSHLAIAFPSTAVHYPLLPYLVLWALQSGAESLTLHSPSSSYLQCVSHLAAALAGLSGREEGGALRGVEVLIRTKRRLRVAEVKRWTEAERVQVLDVVGRGQLPTVAEVWSVAAGKCWKHDNEHCAFNEEQRETSSRLSSKQGGKVEEEHEETKEDTDRIQSGAKRRANGGSSNGRTNGHHADTSNGSSAPFVVTLTAAEHTWDDIVNSVYHIALPNTPASSSSSQPFPPPDAPTAPSSVLRSHILATAFPLYPIHEPNLLLVFTSPLNLLSFPPWLQRVCELDNRPARHAAVWDRRDFELVIERYSTTVQRGGA